jgi:hypothetical protein
MTPSRRFRHSRGQDRMRGSILGHQSVQRGGPRSKSGGRGAWALRAAIHATAIEATALQMLPSSGDTRHTTINQAPLSGAKVGARFANSRSASFRLPIERPCQKRVISNRPNAPSRFRSLATWRVMGTSGFRASLTPLEAWSVSPALIGAKSAPQEFRSSAQSLSFG